MKSNYLLILLLLIFAKLSFSQTDNEEQPEKKKTVYKKDAFGLGIAGAANLTIFQAGYNARLYIPLAKRLNLVTEFYRYGQPGNYDSNDPFINEFYLSMNLSLKLYQKNNIIIYGSAGYVFTRWVNWDNVTGPENFNGAQFTLGSEYRLKKIAFFLEASTNTVYWELNCFLGVKVNLDPKIFLRHKKHHNNILKEGI